MPTYSTGDLTNDLDAIAKIQDLLAAELGDGSGSTTISARALDTLERILAYQDWPIAKQMAAAAWEYYNRALTSPEDAAVPATAGVLGTPFWACLRGLLGDIKTGLVGRGLRMHPKAAENYQASFNGNWPDPSIVFPLVTDMGQCTRAASVWSFVDDQDIDPDFYSGAKLELYCDVLIGAAAIDVTPTVKATEDGDPVAIGPFTIPGTSAQGTTIPCGTLEYIDVTDVSCTGGTDGDQFTIQSIQERDPLA